MDLVYDDVRYMVYKWRFPCLEYFFDVLVSWSRKMGFTASFAVFIFIGFYFGFWFYDYYYYIIYVYILSYHLCSIPLVSCSYHTIRCIFPAWYRLLSLCRSCMPVLMTRFLMHDFDSDLSINVCLSLHATWHSLCYSLGIFWLPWILITRSWSL